MGHQREWHEFRFISKNDQLSYLRGRCVSHWETRLGINQPAREEPAKSKIKMGNKLKRGGK
jgi:hypothetical protein